MNTKQNKLIKKIVSMIGRMTNHIKQLNEDKFDEKFYLKQYPDISNSGMDPYEHYLKHGKEEGRVSNEGKLKTSIEDKKLDTSKDFDEKFYLINNPDILNSGMTPYQHYFLHGKTEGRLGRRPELKILKGKNSLDETKETVLVVSHEASRTGAPILSLNIVHELQKQFNVVTLLLGGGVILENFVDESMFVVDPIKFKGNSIFASLVMEELTAKFNFKFAIVNSIESRVVLKGLALQRTPTITLIHEFASYTRPKNAFHEAILWSSEIVFSTKITHENAISEFPELSTVRVQVIPQGRSTLIPAADDVTIDEKNKEDTKIRRLLRPDGSPQNMVVILGAGTVQYRKGIDLFIEVAAKIRNSKLNTPHRFVWIGKGYDPEFDLGYSAYLADQIQRHGLEKEIFFIDETSSIETAYQLSDILLLSSRLDPLPNVAIDAMANNLPIVCFDNTTGIAEVLISCNLQKECVAQYLDINNMAECLTKLIESPEQRKLIGERLFRAEREYFAMKRYIQQLVNLAAKAEVTTQQEHKNAIEISNVKAFRTDFYLPLYLQGNPLDNATWLGYVKSWTTGISRRKIIPGFQPNIYSEFQHETSQQGIDPLLHYLSAGMPKGPWYNEIIASTDDSLPVKKDVRIALHLHVYYADLVEEIINRLNKNTVRPDLLISAPSIKVAEEVRIYLKDYSGKLVDVEVTQNRGRDIAPLLTTFGKKILSSYDIVGHIHTKKTADLQDSDIGKIWYIFLLENLLGGSSKMADKILGQMTNNSDIGMVFPDDPNVTGWGKNKSHAEHFAKRLNIAKLPDNFVYPVGTMFWARVDAIRPLFDLNLNLNDYPEEPLPYDGSMLHAIERLLPLVMKDKYRSVLTNVVDVTR